MPTPLYVQIADALRADIRSGLYSPGVALPSERKLMRRFGVTRTTVRGALQRLRTEGLIVVERGAGSFVRKSTTGMTEREIAEPNIILRCVVGSTAHGLALEGTDDHDEMAVCLEPPEYVVGLGRFEQWIYRTAEERHRHDPAADQRYRGRTPPSQAGDVDLVAYSLRKWARLAAAGNPTVLLLLFAEPVVATEAGRELQRQAAMFASRQAGYRFLGYLRAQKERLLGLRGQMRVTRTELIKRHGYDTKFAMHAVRLGFQGIEYLTTGHLTLPMRSPEREICMGIRLGEWSLEQVVELIDEQERGLEASIAASPLPERPDHAGINRFLVDAYRAHWAPGG